MSVRVNDRNEGKLQVLNLATKLAVYTLDKCHNEKAFPKKYRYDLANKIVELACDIHCDVSSANSLRIDLQKNYDLRFSYQEDAYLKLNSLIGMVRLAAESKCPINESDIGYWTKLIVDTRSALLSWTRSDKKRAEEANIKTT